MLRVNLGGEKCWIHRACALDIADRVNLIEGHISDDDALKGIVAVLDIEEGAPHAVPPQSSIH